MTDQYTEFDKYKRTGAPVPLSDPPIISQMTDRFVQLTFESFGNFIGLIFIQALHVILEAFNPFRT